MKKEIKDQWIADLRSGKFIQGKGALCKHGKHCCLGVLAQQITNYYVSDDTGRADFGPEKSSAFLDDKLLNQCGLKDLEQGRLSGMNDDGGSTFLEIADYIEQNILDE